MPHAENLNTGIFGSTIVDRIERSIMCCLHGWSAFVFATRRACNKRIYLVKPSILLLSFCLGLFTTAAWAALKPGDAAPDFTVDAALGGKEFKFSLAEALKKGPVVLYFYPKSFTSVCTVEAHEFAENIENFAEAGASVIGLSGDKIEVQRDFSTKECRDKFPVGADPSFSVIKAYDAAFNIPVVGAVNRPGFAGGHFG
jgi:peroxiredoxin